MTPETARLLLPLVQDLNREGPDDFLLGAVSGGADLLEKLGHITEEEYHNVTDLAARNSRALRELLQRQADAFFANAIGE